MEKLPGYISKRIQKAKEQQLKELDLSQDWDSILGLDRIPDEVFELNQLEVLDLSYNALSFIPESISQLKNLKKLILFRNKFTDLPKAILKLQDLVSLKISSNSLQEIPTWLSNLSNLKELDVGFNKGITELERISELRNLTSLDLSFLELATVPEWISKLERLNELSLDYNELNDVPEWISQMPELRKLSLNETRLASIPKWISNMRNLEELSVADNGITTIPEWISNMHQLRALDLSDNKLTGVLELLSKLEKLIRLNLSRCGPIGFPEWIAQLKNIEDLELVDNQINFIPEWVSQLHKLKELNLSGNDLSAIPEFFSQLKNLEVLWLASNRIAVIPDSIGQLRELTRLSLYSNRLSAIPESFSQLKSLTLLYLDNNCFTSIPDVIYRLVSLEFLSFKDNEYIKGNKNNIKELSPRILALENLKILRLDGNPIEIPPPEVVSRGIDAIQDYFRQLEAEGKDYLYEAKLLIVGEGGAGKTSLSKKIVNPEFDLQEDEKSTEGIEVTKWFFDLENGRPFRVNIWDFGGQEIYHSTHQFFLTKRSLYILVADTRKEDTDFYYWLNVVELLSDDSPLLIIKNEKQDRHREINEHQLRGRFSNLQATLATNLANNRGLHQILSEIKHHIVHLPHVGTPLPKTWVKVREALENDPRNHIGTDEYLDTCRQEGFSNVKDKLQLIGYLHDLGVCLHFQEDPILKKIVILKPKWGTDAVYKVLDNRTVIGNLGKFNKGDLATIWREPEYANMQDELLQLMINFKLCYRIPNKDIYIAPQLLTPNQPRYEWDETENLTLRYAYDFMPKGILTQFVVVMHQLISEQNLVWKSGVVLHRARSNAEVIEYYDKREVRIRVNGKNKKELMTIVAYELDKIHSSYRQLKYSKLIPCNCAVCRNSQESHYYRLEILQQFIGDRQDNIQCQRSYEMVDVRGLIDDVISKGKEFEKKDNPHGDFIFRGDIGTVVIQQSEIGDNVMQDKNKDIPAVRSAWANGSFYLFAFAIVMAGLGVLARAVPFYTLIAILIAGILFVPLIGALQLHQDDRLSEKSLMELIKMVIEQLPLLSKLAKQDRTGQ